LVFLGAEDEIVFVIVQQVAIHMMDDAVIRTRAMECFRYDSMHGCRTAVDACIEVSMQHTEGRRVGAVVDNGHPIGIDPAEPPEV
jgi:anti-sigma regulatory factor (Ser/Thr protein kinase)